MILELSFFAAAMIIGLLIGVLVKLHRILALLNERPTLPEWRSTGAFGTRHKTPAGKGYRSI